MGDSRGHLFCRTGRYTIYDQGDLRRVVEWLLSDTDEPVFRTAIVGSAVAEAVRSTAATPYPPGVQAVGAEMWQCA